MRYRVAKPSFFYFMSPASAHNGGGSSSSSQSGTAGGGGASACRLCAEFVPEGRVNFHIGGAGTRGPGTHMGREIVLDTLLHYAKAGFDPALVVRSWPHTLLTCAHFPRMQSMVREPENLHARAEQVVRLLRGLQAMGVLDVAVSPHSEVARSLHATRTAFKRRGAFERFETIGDNSWGSNLSGRLLLLFPDKRWSMCGMHHSFNAARDLAETNSNLERMFDVLQLQSLLPAASRAVVIEGKIKADIVEAVIGELNAVVYAHESTLRGSEEYTEPNGEYLGRLCTLIRHVQSEIFDLTILFMLRALSDNSVPLARELAQQYIFFPAPASSLLSGPLTDVACLTSSGVTPSAVVTAMRPPLDPGDSVRVRRPQFNANFVPTFILPPTLGLLPKSSSCAEDARSASVSVDDELSAFFRYEMQASIAATQLAKKPTAVQQRVKELGGPVAVNGIRPLSVMRPQWDRFRDRMTVVSTVASRLQSGEEDQQQLSAIMTTACLSPVLVHKQRQQQHSSDCGEELATSILSEPPLTAEKPLRSASSGYDGGSDGEHSSELDDGDSVFLWRGATASTCTPASVLRKSIPSRFRDACPFRQLSHFPPHTYNPYGISAAQWMERWQDKATGEAQPEVREMFHTDISESVDVVLAQFEATSNVANSALGAKKPRDSAPAAEQQEKEGGEENRRRWWTDELLSGRTTSVGYSNLTDVATRYLEQLAVADHQIRHQQYDDAPDISQVSAAREEILEMVHPFQDGITVGSDGASLLALSSSIAAVPIDRFHLFDFSFAEQHHEEPKSGESQSSSSSSVSESLDGINIDSIKRRNQMLRGEKVR